MFARLLSSFAESYSAATTSVDFKATVAESQKLREQATARNKVVIEQQEQLTRYRIQQQMLSASRKGGNTIEHRGSLSQDISKELTEAGCTLTPKIGEEDEFEYGHVEHYKYHYIEIVLPPPPQ
jgi:hypothetical protein